MVYPDPRFDDIWVDREFICEVGIMLIDDSIIVLPSLSDPYMFWTLTCLELPIPI